MKESYIEYDFFQLWQEDGIVYEVFKRDTILNVELAKFVVQERLKISNQIMSPIFVDLRNVYSTDTKARKYMASREAVEFITAGAFLIDNEIMKLAGNIFIKIDRPHLPARLFTDKEKAIQWLQNYKS